MIASVLAARVCLGGLADFLPHTDDGCAIETHCIACRAHISAITDVTVPSNLTHGAHEFTYIEAPPREAALERSSRLLPPGRAPPLQA